ncbi:MAG: hypothetical protein ABI581_17350 [Sediminibacterium sp.]
MSEMKLTLFVVLLVSLLTKSLFAQNKHDNTIIVHGFVSYLELKNALFEEGYIPANSDTSFISTNYKPQGMLGEVGFLIKKTDSTLTIRGSVNAKLGDMELRGEPLENVGQKGTVYRVGFSTMTKIANSFRLPITFLNVKK